VIGLHIPYSEDFNQQRIISELNSQIEQRSSYLKISQVQALLPSHDDHTKLLIPRRPVAGLAKFLRPVVEIFFTALSIPYIYHHHLYY